MTQIKTIFSIIYTFLSKNTIKKLLFFYNTNVNIQWGYGSASKNATIHSVGEIKATLPIRINTLYCAIGNMGGSAACVMQVNLRNNTQIGGSWDSFQYNTPNPARWRYILIGA